MAMAATTIHRALMGSPRRSATTPSAQAPSTASASQGSWRTRGESLFMTTPGLGAGTADPDKLRQPCGAGTGAGRTATGQRRLGYSWPMQQETNMQATDERRRFSRIAFDASVELSDGTQTWTGTLRDISLRGLLVEEPADWSAAPGSTLQARVLLDPATSLEMQVELRHRRDGLLGFACQHIDIDSISHLRRLVELNLGDPSLLERALTALGPADD